MNSKLFNINTTFVHEAKNKIIHVVKYSTEPSFFQYCNFKAKHINRVINIQIM